MIRYCCDLCHRPLNPDQDLRYVVKMEVFAAFDPSADADRGDEHNHLEEIREILEELEQSDDSSIGEDVYRELKFDLCPDCQRKFVKNPLGRETAKLFEFSKN
jgi:hypothetical protein